MLCCAESLSQVWLFLTFGLSPARLSCPWDFFQARTLEWVAIYSSRGSSQPRDGTCISCVSCTAGRFFTHGAIRERFNPDSGVCCDCHKAVSGEESCLLLYSQPSDEREKPHLQAWNVNPSFIQIGSILLVRFTRILEYGGMGQGKDDLWLTLDSPPEPSLGSQSPKSGDMYSGEYLTRIWLLLGIKIRGIETNWRTSNVYHMYYCCQKMWRCPINQEDDF